MHTGWIIFLVCIVFVLGAALPLISKRDARRHSPPPRKETLRDWRKQP